MSTPHRVIAYHQSHRRDGQFVSLTELGRQAPLTHLLVSAVHLADDGRVVLNDHAHDDPHHDELWQALEPARQRGVKIMAMVGGWAPGTTDKLEQDFDRWYPVLRDFLRAHEFDGIDLDVEQPMQLAAVERIIDALRADFGPDFIIALAPVATALTGGKNLSGFDYEALEASRGEQIDFYLVQFYSGFARADDAKAYRDILERGVFTPDRLVLGMIGEPGDASYIDPAGIVDAVADLAGEYPDFAGVDIWEFPRQDQWPDLASWSAELAATMARVAPAQEEILGLLPQPRSLTRTAGQLVLPRRLPVHAGPDTLDVLADLLAPGTGLRLERADEASQSAVLAVEVADLPPGGYRLRVTESQVTLTHLDAEGLVNAISTLRQLLPDWVHGQAPLPDTELVIPCCEVEDHPSMSWRGMHLDVARHFQPLPFLYRFVDLLAMHRFNRLHLHLTDDQGWRFEVHKYPLLTTIGAGRTHSYNPGWAENDGTPHGGYYTQDQLRALVGYASRRGITIVPEIDLPGHVRALLAAYPQYGDLVDLPPNDETRRNGGDRVNVATTWGVYEEVLHLDDDAVEMVTDIFAELLEVFDSPWIHIGGDECPRAQWRASTRAAELAAERGLPGVDQLQPWFTEQLRSWLAERGRTMIGWDEIMDDGEVPGSVVMAWRGRDAAVKAAAAGHPVVLATWRPTYLDTYQGLGATEPFAIGGFTTWQDIAAFDPMDGIPADQRDLVLGMQGQLWSEYLRTSGQVEYMAFPRACVVAEVAWHGAAQSPSELGPRLRRHLRRLDAAAVNYRPLEGPHLWQQGGTGLLARPEGHRHG